MRLLTQCCQIWFFVVGTFGNGISVRVDFPAAPVRWPPAAFFRITDAFIHRDIEPIGVVTYITITGYQR
jgi:hypothetical protein